MTRDEITDWLRLLLTPRLGAATQRRLLAAIGLPAQVFAAPPAALAALATPAQVQALRQKPPGLDALAAATCQWLEAGDTPQGPTRRLITLADTDYPPALLQADDPPLLLHAMGLPLAAGPLAWPTHALAMVGSRNPTPQGLGTARAFARHFTGRGWTVVSGLALGIDGAAHEGALAGAAEAAETREGAVDTDIGARGTSPTIATVAVVGTGLDRPYPRQHEALARRIAERGLVLSEFTLGTPPLRENFPRRNRLIAALSRGTLVVEAALQSGSLITARLAAEMGREVFAIPGSIHAPQARGCHALIRQGAKLVETAEDVLEELRPSEPPPQGAGDTPARAPVHAPSGPNPASGAALTSAAESASAFAADTSAHPSDDEALLRALGYAPSSLDALMARTGWPADQLLARLLTLELGGQVGPMPGGLFQRIASG